MLEPRIHTFVAYAFAENFHIGETIAELAASPSLMDPKACVTRVTASGGRVFAYNFGALCFMNTPPAERELEIQVLREQRSREQPKIGLSEPAVWEDFIVEEHPDERPRVDFSKIVLDRLTSQRAEVIAFTVAQSAAMSFYESYVIKVSAKVSEMVDRLAKHGSVGRRPKRLHKLIAEAIEMRSEIVGVLHLLDRPELIWEDKIMDSLYEDLRTVFDLQERFEALVHKLDFIQQTMELLLDMARDSRGFLLELSVLTLIFFELAMTLLHEFR